MRYPLPSDYTRPISPRKDKTLGYLYFMDKDHPLASKTGRVYHHRHMLSVKIGRWLQQGEDAHHKDENRINNSPSNLRLRKKSIHAKVHAHMRFPNSNTGRWCRCRSCSGRFKGTANDQKFCSPKCCHTSLKRFNPSAEELRSLVWRIPTARLKLQYGVSDVAVKKRCKKLGIATPPRGFWMKPSSYRLEFLPQVP